MLHDGVRRNCTTVFLLLAVVWAISKTSAGAFLERTVYDFGVRFFDNAPSKRVAVIAIDEKSLANMGRWPWSRNFHAAMIERLGAGGAKVIGYPIFFLEPEQDQRLNLVDDLLSKPDLHELQGGIVEIPDPERRQKLEEPLTRFLSALLQIRSELDVDAQLAQAIGSAGNVVLPYHVGVGKQLGRPDAELPGPVKQGAIHRIDGEYVSAEGGATSLVAVYPPLDVLAESASSLGHILVSPDPDGVIRSAPLLADYYGTLLPSMPLQLVIKALNLDLDDVTFDPDQGIRVGGLEIVTDRLGKMLNLFYGSKGGYQPFSVDSFYDVVAGNISPTKYSGQVVLVGTTAAGIGDYQVTSVDSAMMPIMLLAHTVSNLLNEDFVSSPRWTNWAIIAGYVFVCAYLIFFMSLMRAGIAAAASGILLLALVITEIYSLSSLQIWIPLAAPMLLLFLGHWSITTISYLKTERGKRHSDRESAEGNRMLGLSFQGQGQLDLAFEKFQKCPLDEGMLKLLYNLALDFERKRQFSKAAVVYQYMESFDSKYKDIQQRRERALSLENAVILGSGNQSSGPGASIVMSDGAIEKPMLGRYEIEKELGKGAMGIVYLGKDPKIGREVAIKTMALAQEFDEDELESVKERFFREAETAGRLSHPNIVTVYDAGNEHDLAYIAMEFLPGYEMTKYTKKGELLPIQDALECLVKAAEALAYAHSNNVVHRDIKPSNMMFNPENHHVTLTDFGIARITDSSKTKTGTILGTPSYMSPEQFKGEKSDGRADIFALGVTAFQLLTGDLPFKGDSMASLMYAIANEPYPSPFELRPELPESIDEVFHNALAKDREDRYACATQMAEDLRFTLAELGG